MQLTPAEAAAHLKESIASYIESQYRISHPLVFAERADLLRQQGAIAQDPFIESTPAFAAASLLSELEERSPPSVPPGLSELVNHGLPVDRFPLYTHQEEALLASFGEAPNLLVATGTGSGKTEAFVLPILSRMLKEAQTWEEPVGFELESFYDPADSSWQHSRRHERRDAALRAIILYPMNALVNDQMSRLRRVLSHRLSQEWQREHLNGNLIHFGMYTSLTPPTRSPEQSGKREEFAEYAKHIEEEWMSLTEELRATGNWPAPGGSEMLCRWDMQAAPPDILVTNYSMLEYMLIRPIESPIFERTREWLSADTTHEITLVLDEAHTYTGAKGTEVAHLVRRLKERLGLRSGSSQFRAIATSASVPSYDGADEKLVEFVSDLFGEPEDSFSLIHAGVSDSEPADRQPDASSMLAFASFHDHFSHADPWPAIKALAAQLHLEPADEGLDPQVALYRLLSEHEDLLWTRARTARNATRLSELSEECWGIDSELDIRQRATAGLLAAGSFARAIPLADTPPILSMRLHTFFRGVPGFWACLNPDCPEVPPEHRGDRPVGAVYLDPRPWCTERCGSRVLELFSCRKCGLLFVGGIPDRATGGLWPWSDDFSGERQERSGSRIFGVESPGVDVEPHFRSTRTTLVCDAGDNHSRTAYPVALPEGEHGGVTVNGFPEQCPRCRNYRAPNGGREIIEPLRTRGPRSISVLMEDTLRVQPTSDGTAGSSNPKALIFSDSRQDAAQLAGDLRRDHRLDAFRQLLVQVLHSCETCQGRGIQRELGAYQIGQEPDLVESTCADCGGSGERQDRTPIEYQDLRRSVIELQIERDMDPTEGHVRNAFRELSDKPDHVYEQAHVAFDLSARREISQADFGLEPLGIAAWSVRLPERTGALDPLTDAETHALLRTVARILATENILLPPEPKRPWEWPYDERIEAYERQRMIPARRRVRENIVPYNLSPYRKLGRYVRAVGQALAEAGRISDLEQWLHDLHWPLWRALKGFDILVPAGPRVEDQTPHGIRIDAFELRPVVDKVFRCRACRYVMGEVLLNVCYRCGQQTEQVDASSISNFYRRSALLAGPATGFPDPFPMQVAEHTAATRRREARDIERWFQDLFRPTENEEDHRIAVLSVTTTMEMGIDIGSLLSVGLRNVAPTVANYQQRAGRAGRRGSAVATVVTYALDRSHDQYYFHQPNQIVSEPPRVPVLYVGNGVIAHRHVRSLVLGRFFSEWLEDGDRASLFAAWGNAGHFLKHHGEIALSDYVERQQSALIEQCTAIVDSSLHAFVAEWLAALAKDVQVTAEGCAPADDLLMALMLSGLLPKYAFPVDVVKLSIPDDDDEDDTYESQDFYSGISRDLQVALSEYAPGAEIIIGRFPETYIYRSAAVYDPSARVPDYRPRERLSECRQCKAVTLTANEEQPPSSCPECGGSNMLTVPYLRPRGFSVDAAEPEGGRRKYTSGGRERAGFTPRAQLLVGASALDRGTNHADFAPKLFSLARVGDLFMRNMGPDWSDPGFVLCPTCGRHLEAEHLGRHTYPTDVPPHRGRRRGPRAGEPCPNVDDFDNRLILGHRFRSEVVLLAVDMPGDLDAPIMEPSGLAVWHSFGTLLAEAAARYLQISPDEIRVGVRPMRDSLSRVQGEVFIYDNVPGGAGYARAIKANLREIAELALDMAWTCPNSACGGACYHCLLAYSNQPLHNLLDRRLGASVLEYLLFGELPTLSAEETAASVSALSDYVMPDWTTVDPARLLPPLATAFSASGARQVGVWPIHPLAARPPVSQLSFVREQTGIGPSAYTTFDLRRRPFWVAEDLFGRASH